MKKLLLTLLGALLALPAFARDGEVFNYTYQGKTLTYTIINEAAKTVCTKSGVWNDPGNYVSGDLIIPSTVENEGVEYTVTEIGESGFYKLEGLTSVTIPNSVTKIGNRAFALCQGLTSVSFGNSVSEIGREAFSACYELTSITIPNSVVKIGERAFQWCRSLTSVTIPNSVVEIGLAAFKDCTMLLSVEIPNSVIIINGGTFYGCSSLTSVIIGNSVTEIGGDAFRECSSLTSIEIPNSVTEIGQLAFNECTGLTSVTIPASVTSIGKIAFGECNSLTKFDVASDNSNYTSDNGVLFNKDMTTLIQYPAAKSQQEYKIPNTVTYIGLDAFYNAVGLTSITIPNSVTEMNEGAFANCTGLTKAEFSSIEHLCSIIFGDDSNPLVYAEHLYINGKEITKLVIPNSVTSIGEYTFANCSGLTSVTIPNSVTKIDDDAFAGCSGLTFVKIPNSVTEIGHSVFSDCTGLTSVTIPSFVTEFGSNIFKGCTSLTSVTYLAADPVEGYIYDGFFANETYENATLNYLQSAEEKIATTYPWNKFKNRIGRDANFVDDSSISEVENFSTEAVAVYDMRGVKVGESTEGLSKGIYIIREGSTTRKIAI